MGGEIVKRYPALEFLIRIRNVIAWLVGGFFALAGIYTWSAGPAPEYEGQNPGWIGLELIVIGFLAWFAVKSAVEILEVLINIEHNTRLLANAATKENQSIPSIERKTA
jgi:hypothetical protein